jgi:hypothetical protein
VNALPGSPAERQAQAQQRPNPVNFQMPYMPYVPPPQGQRPDGWNTPGGSGGMNPFYGG